jgi:hypothetical protein
MGTLVVKKLAASVPSSDLPVIAFEKLIIRRVEQHQKNRLINENDVLMSVKLATNDAIKGTTGRSSREGFGCVCPRKANAVSM